MKEGEGVGGSPTRERGARRESSTNASTRERRSSQAHNPAPAPNRERRNSTERGESQHLGAGLFIVLKGGVEIMMDSQDMQGRKE